jgi:hypothetical protein
MAKGVRVNLSVPEHFDTALTQLAEHSGRSKASWVMEAIEFQFPAWCKRLEAMKYGTPLEVLPSAENKGRVELARSQRQLRAIERYDQVQAKPVAAEATPAVRLTRQQRRAMEREERKAKLRAQRGR